MKEKNKTKEATGYFECSDRLNTPLEVFLHKEEKEKSYPTHPHWHYFLEMIYVIGGSVNAACNGKNYILKPGDLIIFYPQSVHSLEKINVKDEKVVYYVIMSDLNFLNITNSYKTRFSRLFKLAYEKNTENIIFRKNMLKDIAVKQIMNNCLEEMRHKNYGYDIIICSNISMLLTHLVRLLRDNGMDTDKIITETDQMNASINSISEYIDSHYAETLKVSELARMCQMSYSYFAKLFKETYNQSCKEYIEFIRLNKVADLLRFTNMDLNYISQETGFADCSHLIRTFKKWKGVTPKQWKKEN